MSSQKPTYNVALILFPEVDILDFAGPLEMLSHFSHDIDHKTHGGVFSQHVIAATSSIWAGDCLTVNADTLLSDARAKIDEYDILVVPGGRPDIIQRMAQENSPEVQFIREFASQPAKEGRSEKIILSICTGALFLGAVGALKGLKAATSHAMAIPTLREMCAGSGNGEDRVEIVDNTRFVDGGLNSKGVRVITAGGITCGLDAALFLGQLKTSENMADFVAQMSEYERRRN
ncbi:MAG: hypothetical protein M1835_003326 [Candelina submexicana]|nr:MAG: hypothetical protein M1835_003326 [Candelina submexicana]